MNSSTHRVSGRIHSVETGGTIDGPGIRYVVFVQGCPLRCQFCHNPDTWFRSGGKNIFADEVVADILHYKNFIKTGGVTISGGEPLMQIPFVTEILRGCKENGIHTAVDTSGAVEVSTAEKLFSYTDLILLDIKANDTKMCQTLTGKGNENAFKMLDYLNDESKAVWIRHVVVPGFTDDLREASLLAEKLKDYRCIQKIEILPFHKMGEYKWEALQLNYKLKETKEPAKDVIENIKQIFRAQDFWVA